MRKARSAYHADELDEYRKEPLHHAQRLFCSSRAYMPIILLHERHARFPSRIIRLETSGHIVKTAAVVAAAPMAMPAMNDIVFMKFTTLSNDMISMYLIGSINKRYFFENGFRMDFHLNLDSPLLS